MQSYLRSRKATIIREHYKEPDGLNRPEKFVPPPLNTDVRFSKTLPLHQCSKNGLCKLKSHSYEIKKNFEEEIIIPPLNTDIRFSTALPLHDTFGYEYNPHDHEHAADEHSHDKHIHEHTHENFSWAIPTSHDSSLDLIKKTLMHHVQKQHACGSCWAMCLAAVISDCLVISGAVGWAPNISSTYIMMCLPKNNTQNGCGGGHPGMAARILETKEMADTSCVDYSWCSGDSEICTSISSARHFDAEELTSKLNANIPTPCGCYYSDTQKYAYKINPGSEVFFINSDAPVDVFRATVKAHILDFGPTIGGFVVFSNFEQGIHTNPALNGGVYFDRANYDDFYDTGELTFRAEANFAARGLHAISIVGWGMAKNIKYDNDKVGDVPYWHCRNSWDTTWGHAEGYFKMAMYPFNKVAQFDTEVMTTAGGPVGSMILIRATEAPVKKTMAQISRGSLAKIRKSKPTAYYQSTPEDIRRINRENLPDSEHGVEHVNGTIIRVLGKNRWLWIIAGCIVIVIIFLS